MATVKNIEKLTQMADERFVQGKFQEALHFYTRIIDLDPPNLSDFLIKRSMTYLRVGLHDEAMNDGVRTISLQPSKSTLIACYICIGRACVNLKKFDTAKKAFRQAIQVDGISPSQRQEIEKEAVMIDKIAQQAPNQQFSSNNTQQDDSMEDIAQPHQHHSNHVHSVLAEKLGSQGSDECAELECPLCYRVFYQPVTLPCGHTFDRACLARVFDYTSKCPLCREVIHILPDQYPITVALNNLIQKYFVKEFEQRKQEEQQVSTSPDKNNLPLFLMVDHVLYPLTKLIVHVFEPRYRLMMRRCMSGSRTFGLVTYGNEGGVSKFGTLAKITAFQVLPDGRCLIEAVGDKRFAIQSTWEQDGYTCGRVEWFNEEKPINEDEQKKVHEASERAFAIVQRMFASVGASQVKQAIEQKIGKMPSSSQPEHFSFWLSSLLSLSALSIQDKVNLLKQTSTRKRLDMLTPLAEGVFNYYKQQKMLSASPFQQQQTGAESQGYYQQNPMQQPNQQSCCLQ